MSVIVCAVCEIGVCMRKIKGRKKSSGQSRSYIAIMALFLVIVMCAQLFILYNKSVAYAEKEEALKQELSGLMDRQQELEDYELYTQSDEYTKNTAQSKLGLVYENEIVFRER